MAERCAFAGNCPMQEDIISISGACTTERGEVCGPVAAYGMLIGKDRLIDADELDPILGTFTFTRVPAGSPPLEIREEWVGVEVPVRDPESMTRGEVPVSSDDVELSLLSQGRIDAASWFIALAYRHGSYTATFQADEGEYTPRNDIASSLDYYGRRLSPEVRAAVEEG